MAGCTALSCPRSAYWFTEGADPNNQAMSVSVPTAQLTRDKTGHTWCNYCQKHRALMDYGHEHRWPKVEATGQQGSYEIWGEQSEWFTSIACGNQDMIDAFYAELIGTEQVA